MTRFINKHRRFLYQLMLSLLIVLECFKFSVSVVLAQSTGTTVYTNTEGQSICRSIQIPPLGAIPSNALMTRESCENLSLTCPSSGTYRCIAEATPTGLNMVRFYCPNPGGQWQRLNTPCTDTERANELGHNRCYVAGGYMCVKGQEGVRGGTSYQRYVCISSGSNWSPTSSPCTEAEIAQTLSNESGVSGITLEENVIGQYLLVPNSAQGSIECYSGTERMCVNGAYCQYSNGGYNWVTARPNVPEQVACYNQRPIVLNEGDQLAPGENRCPVNAARCECVSLVYAQDLYLNGSPTFETIGPGERCGVADPLSMSVVHRVFFNNQVVASRAVEAVPVTLLQDDILRGGVEGAIDVFGAENVAHYADVCSAYTTQEEGYLECLKTVAPVGLGAGAAVVVSVAAFQLAAAWISAQGGITAVLQAYGYYNGIGALSASTGLDFLTAKAIIDQLILSSAYLPVVGTAAVAFLDDLGPLGSAIKETFAPVIEVVENLGNLAGLYGDEAINYGDDAIRVVSGTTTLISDCAKNQLGLNTVSGVYDAAMDPLNEVVAGTAVNATVEGINTDVAACGLNLIGEDLSGTTETGSFIVPVYGGN